MHGRSFTQWLRMAGRHLLVIAVLSVAAYASIHLLAATDAYAQVDASNLEAIQETSGLGNEDIRVTIGRIIRAVLGFLGVIALALVLYAGFMWMTAAGNEDQVETAKKILIRAAIGLLIILAAFSITQFVLSRLGEATGTQVDTGNGGSDGLGTGGSGSGAAGGVKKNFAVKTFAPTGKVPIYNVTVHVVFTDDVDDTTAKKGITVRKAGSEDTVPATVGVSGAHVTVRSDALCPDGATKGCFEKNTQYVVEVAAGGNGVKSKNGKTVTCGIGATCTNAFTTGDAYDTKVPSGSIISPVAGSKISQGGDVLIEALVNDDAGVSLVEFFVDGAVIDTVSLPSGTTYPATVSTHAWNTSALALKSSHKVVARVYDVDDHSVRTDEVMVAIAAAHCFDGVKTDNTDELGADCSPKGGDCALCKDASCDADADCQSGMCAPAGDGGAKQCVEIPQITKISPVSGGFGQWVTIQGKYFGSSGTVSFLGENDVKIAATLVACSGGASWTNTSIIISVPAGLVDGKQYPIMVENAAGSDTTTNTWGPKITNAFVFKQDATPSPGLCSVVPGSEKPGQQVMLFGDKLSGTGQTVRFGNTQTSVVGTSNDHQVGVSVPQVAAGTVSVSVEVAGQKSNPVPFTVLGLGGNAAPSIGAVSPSKGPAKQYFTITGKNFGEFQNTIKFIKLNDELVPTDTTYLADFSFPAMCAAVGLWTDTSVVAKVPNAPNGKYQMVVIRTDADNDPANNESNAVLFEITAGTPLPGVCAVVPNNGPAKTPVSLHGEFFGNDPGSVVFSANKNASFSAADWGEKRVDTSVPVEAQSGPVYTSTVAGASNVVPFTVQNCNTNANVCGKSQQCCGNGSCIPLGTSCSSYNVPEASYTFSFFTGTSDSNPNDYPPAVIEECSTGKLPSPTPWVEQQGGIAACTSAAVGIKFTIPITADSLRVNKGAESTVQLYPCTGTGSGVDACASFAATPTDINEASVTYIPQADGDGTKNSFASYYSFTPSQPFQAGMTYMVVLTPGITGAVNGMSMVPNGTCAKTAASGYGAYCFAFTIAESGGACSLGSVQVSPAKHTITALSMIQPVTKYILDPTAVLTTDAATGVQSKMYNPLVWVATGIAKESKCLVVNVCTADTQWSWSSAAPETAVPHDIPNEFSCKQYMVAAGESKKILNDKGAVALAPAVVTAKESKNGVSDTGDIFINYGVPRVIEQCGDGVQSPTPWSGRAGGDTVCTNAAINVVFTHTMDAGSFSNASVYLEECTGTGAQPCATAEKIPSTFKTYVQDDTHSGLTMTRAAGSGTLGSSTFEAEKWYRVGLTTALKSESGMSMEPLPGCRAGESYCFTFKTRGLGLCSVAAIEVTPTQYTATALGLVVDKKGNPVIYRGKALAEDACIVLDVPNTQWSWWAAPFWTPAAGSAAMHDPIANKQFDHIDTTGPEQQVWAKAQTPPGTPARIEAYTSTAGHALLTILVEPPRILQVSPSCTTACSNADLSVSFTQEITPQSITLLGTPDPADIVVLPCANESCLFAFDTDGVLKKSAEETAVPISLATSASGLIDAGGTSSYQLHIKHQPFASNTYYRVLVRVGPQGVRSVAGSPVAMDSVPVASRYPKQTPQYYSWTFKTKGDGAPCGIASAKVQPVKALVNAPGIVKQFVAQAFGAPDSCSPSAGQMLDATSYDWNWSLGNTQVANFVTGKAVATVSYAQSPFCTDKCIAKGSYPMGTPTCGNNKIETGEECDAGDLVSGDGCSAVCLHEGSKTTAQGGTCGNSTVDAHEDCDGTPGCSQTCTNIGKTSGLAMCGNGDVGAGEECDGGVYCTKDCLWKGSQAAYSACTAYQKQYAGASCTGITVCGNGVAEPGEDTFCEQKAAAATSPVDIKEFCSDTCTFIGGKPQLNKQILAYCGDGTPQPYLGEACDDGNNSKGDGCSETCLLEGASPYYNVASFCGDGQTGVGESLSCEQPDASAAAVSTGKNQPTQYVVGLEGGPVVNNTRETTVAASVLNTKASGTGAYAIQCGYTNESQCPNTTLYGLGSDSCCYLRPEVIKSTVTPNNDKNVCRNALLSVEFTDQVDPATITSSSVIVKYTTADEQQCTSQKGSVVAYYAVDPYDPWYRRAWFHMVNTVRGWFDSAPVYASVQCAIETTFTLGNIQDLGEVPKTRSKLFISPLKALAPNVSYTVELKNTIKNLKGIALKAGLSGNNWQFQTGAALCQLAGVYIEPPLYMFTRPGAPGAGTFVAVGFSQVQGKKQPIVPMNQYAWEYTWNVVDPARAQIQGDASKPAASVSVQPGSERGNTILRAVAKITTDTFTASSTAGTSFVGLSKLMNVNCEVPWPASSGTTWSPFANETAHFSTWYCRGEAPEAGKAIQPALPSLLVGTVVDKTPGVLVSYLLRNEQNGDAIGIRVHENPKHLSPAQWYEEKFLTGAPKPITVNGYEAIQDGATVYVNAANFEGKNLPWTWWTGQKRYTNMYVISYNEDASPETKRIYEQVFQNLEFNTNIGLQWNQGVCSKYGDPNLYLMVQKNGQPAQVNCSTHLDCIHAAQNASIQKPDDYKCLSLNAAVARDVRRLSDVGRIADALESYNMQYGSYPTLKEGTYIPAMTVSSWQSWGEGLGKTLGIDMPLDPINAYRKGCNASDDGTDAATCWNAKQSRYTCLAGSSMYEYRAAEGGKSYVLKVPFETDMYSWKQTWGGVTSMSYEDLADTCKGQPVVVGGVCGDGILGAAEDCEVGMTVGGVTTSSPMGPIKCTYTSKEGTSYPGKYVYSCPNTCKFLTAQEVQTKQIACQPLGSCGDGKVNGGEVCDDGNLNGSYNHCSLHCDKAVSDAGKCGDAVMQKNQGEMCDLGGACLFFPDKACKIGNFTCPQFQSAVDLGNGMTRLNLVGVSQSGGGGFASIDVPSSQVPTGLKQYTSLPCVPAQTVYNTVKQNSCNWDCLSYGPHCGDGVVQDAYGEECEGPKEVGSHTASCLNGKVMRACTSACKLDTSVADTCVPDGFSGGAPSAQCGNGVKEGNENCDDGISNGAACVALYGGSCNYCSLTCKNITLSGGQCGDGVRQLQEECDGADLAGKSCTTYGGKTGQNLQCNSNCTFDKSACKP